MEYIPAVVQAVPGNNFTVYAYFSDGTVRLATSSRSLLAAAYLPPSLMRTSSAAG